MTEMEKWVQDFYQTDIEFTLEDIWGQKFWIPVLRGLIYNEQLDDLFQIPYVNGLLLSGKPGVGKTVLARAFCGELSKNGYRVLYIRAKDLVETEETIQEKIQQIVKECMIPGKIAVLFGGMDFLKAYDKAAYYLAEGLEQLEEYDNPVLWIMTTADEEKVPGELLKFLQIFRIMAPTDEERREFLQKKLENLIPVSGDFTLKNMVMSTEGYNFEELNRLTMMLKLQIKEEFGRLYENNTGMIEYQIKNQKAYIRKSQFEQVLGFTKLVQKKEEYIFENYKNMPDYRNQQNSTKDEKVTEELLDADNDSYQIDEDIELLSPDNI